MKRGALGAAAAALLAAGGWLVVTIEGAPPAAAQAPAAAPAAPSVPVIIAEARDVAEAATFTGRLAAVQHVELRPRVSGYITAVKFREGSLVARGDVLFELDARPFEAAVARARAQLAQAEERQALTARKATRATRLRSEDIISAAEHESATAEQADSAAGVDAARAALRAAMIDLADTRVRAPIDGRAGEAMITTGNLVSSATPLTTIVSVDPLHVEIDMDEPTFRRVSTEGERERSIPVRVSLDGEPGPGREAHIDYLANQVDPTTGTARARAVLANPDGRLTPGLFARVRVETGAARPVVLVRDEAIGTGAQGRFVLVVNAEGIIEARPVELGEMIDGLRAIRAGVSAGEQVVLKGMVRPGMKVSPAPVPLKGGAS